MNLMETPGLVTGSAAQPNQYVKGQIDALKLYFTGSENALANIPDLQKVLIKIDNHEYTPLAKEIISFVNENKTEIFSRKKLSLAGNTPLNEVDELLYQIAKANASFKDSYLINNTTLYKDWEKEAIPDVKAHENKIRQQAQESLLAKSADLAQPSLLKNPFSWLKSKLPFLNRK